MSAPIVATSKKKRRSTRRAIKLANQIQAGLPALADKIMERCLAAGDDVSVKELVTTFTTFARHAGHREEVLSQRGLAKVMAGPTGDTHVTTNNLFLGMSDAERIQRILDIASGRAVEALPEPTPAEVKDV